MMNLPNKLTIFRCILIPFFVYFLLYTQMPYGKTIAGVLFLIACFTDALDGFLARKYHWITNFGKLMDPLADKILVCSALICFLALHWVPVWFVLIIIAREFIISGIRLIATEQQIVIAASIWGKIKTILQMGLCIVFLLPIPEKKDFIMVQIGEPVLLYLTAIVTIISLLDYIWKNRKIFIEKEATL